MPDDHVSNRGAPESKQNERSEAGRSVRRSRKPRRKPPARRLKLIPPADIWQAWDSSYGVPVLRGQVVVGEHVMLAVERHYRDMQDGHKRGLAFDAESAWHVIEFIEKYFCHIKGDKAGQPVILDPWQKFWTAVLYGWRNTDGTRRFRRGYEEVARKNGKSTWKAPQGVYLWMMDGEPGAEVYAVATTRGQAMTIFKPAFENVKRWCRRSPRLRQSIRVFEGLNQERIEIGASVFRPMPANAEAQDGYNPSAILYDELHAQRSRDQWDVLESGFGARRQPLLTAVTTAGWIPDGICTEMRDYLLSVLRGERVDDSFFGYVYTLDKGDDKYDESVWIKANPGLGTIKNLSYMRDMARKAKALPGARANFETKDLNLWRNTSDGWVDLDVWDKGKAAFDPAQLSGRRCFGGLDLASVQDLTAFVLVFPPEADDAPWHVLANVWCPAAKLEESVDDAAPYRKWAELGWLTVTEGNVTDYRVIRDTILQARAQYEIVSLGFDKWNAQDTSNELSEQGVPLVEIAQNTGGMYPGTKKLEELIYSKRLLHGGNPLLRWCIGNVALLFDSNGNYRPDKKRSNARIDPVVAMVMALGRAAATDGDEEKPGFILL